MKINKQIVWLVVFSLVMLHLEPLVVRDKNFNNLPVDLFYPFKERVAISYRRLKGKELLNYLRLERMMRKVYLLIAILAGIFLMKYTGGDSELSSLVIFVIAGLGKEIIFDNEIVKAIDDGDKIILEYKQPQVIVIKKGSKEMETEIVRMCQLKTVDGKKYIVQEEISEIFGISRQRINHRWMMYLKHGFDWIANGGIKQTKTVLNSAVLKRVAEIVVHKPWTKLRQISEQLKEEGITNKILPLTDIYNAVKVMDGLFVQKLMREMVKRGDAGKQLNEEYLIERLLELVGNLFHLIESSANDRIKKLKAKYIDIKEMQQKFRKNIVRRGPYKRDKHTVRINLERDKLRKEKRLEKIITTGKIDTDCCPDCGERLVSHKETRCRKYTNGKGEKVYDTVERKYCTNPDCPTKTFTVSSQGLEPWARYDIEVKGKGFKLIFHVRGSSQRSSDYVGEEDGIKASPATFINWVIKASAELVNINYFFPPVWSGKMSVDEKWIKLLKRWIYVYEAVDALTGEILHSDVFLSLDKVTAKTFLYQIKSLGYIPEVIVTDLTSNYDEPMKEVFPGVKSHKCVLHAEMAADKLVKKYFPVKDHHKKVKGQKETNQILREGLKKIIRHLFESKTPRQLNRRYRKFLSYENKYPVEAKPMFKMVKEYFPVFLECLKDVGIPRTNNTVEGAIGEFAAKYQNTKGFTSFDGARAFVRIYLVYSKFRKYSSGRFKGMNHLELQGYIPNINWIEFITATTYPNKKRAPPQKNATFHTNISEFLSDIAVKVQPLTIPNTAG